MQGIYTYIPETNYVSREYRVAAVLLLLFMVLISLVPVLNLLYFYFSTFRSMCVVVFCSLLLLLLLSLLLLGVFAKLRELLLTSSCLSVCLSIRTPTRMEQLCSQ